MPQPRLSLNKAYIDMILAQTPQVGEADFRDVMYMLTCN